MGKTGLWKVHPIKNEIILILIRHKGEMLDTDLLRALQNEYTELSRNSLSKVLFNLEVDMVIDVQRLRKNVNKISLRKNAPIHNTLKKFFK